jgi:phosphate uptake regulator
MVSRKESVMEDVTGAARVSPESCVAEMRQETEEMLRQVMEAVNRAPDGAWINASEEKVRDVLAEYRRRVYEKALQMRTDVAEGAFSPGRRPNG